MKSYVVKQINLIYQCYHNWSIFFFFRLCRCMWPSLFSNYVQEGMSNLLQLLLCKMLVCPIRNIWSQGRMSMLC